MGRGFIMTSICYDNYFWQNGLVRLRAMLPEDWEERYYNRFDSKARQFLNAEIELPPTKKEEKENTEKYSNFNPGTGRIMFVIETLDGIPVGSINLNSIDERNGTFSIGLLIYMNFRGKGYGTCAMKILLGYAFFERRLNKFNGACSEENTASIAMQKKLGCVQEGIRRQQDYSKGRYWDEVLFGLTKDEYIMNNRQ